MILMSRLGGRLTSSAVILVTMAAAMFGVAAPANAVLPTGAVGHSSTDSGYYGNIWIQCRANNDVVGLPRGRNSTHDCPGAGRVVYIIVRWGTTVTCQNGDVYKDYFPSTGDRYHHVGIAEYVGSCTIQKMSWFD